MPVKLEQIVFSILMISSGVFSQEKTGKASSIWDQEALLGDWGGVRSAFFEKGYEFNFEYTAEVFSNVSGGGKTGNVYNGLGYASVGIDAEKILDWSGVNFHFATLWTHGVSPGQYTGNELAVSNIDAYDGLRLHEFYIEKEFEKLNLKIGNLLADEDFVGSVYREVLINDAFGQTASWSANTLNGGPAFNAPGLGLHLRYDISKAVYMQAGIYDGDVFDDANGDPAINQHGTHFELGNGQGWTSLYQIGYNGFNVSDGKDLPGWYRLGAWHHTSEFEKHDGAKTDGNAGIFASIDKLVFREQDEQGLGLFGRMGAAKRDRSRFHWTMETGMNYKGLIPGRDEDVTSLGYIYGKHSHEIATVKSHESVLELTYLYQVSPAVYIQPDIQWINRPSGDNAVGDAWAIGLRVGFTF